MLLLKNTINSQLLGNTHQSNINIVTNTLETKISRKLVQLLKLLESITTIICQYIFSEIV